MRPTLEQIADKASVSLSTASRVLNNQPNVAPATRQRVLDAFRQLSPPRRQQILIGIVVPDTKNPFFTELAFELDRECEARDASLMIVSSDGRADRELVLLERFMDIGVDGVLFISSGTGRSEALIGAVSDPKMPPVVAFDRGTGRLDQVTVDSRKGAEQALEHLASYGHHRIGYLRGLSGTDTATERFESFRLAMAKRDFELNPRWLFDGDFQLRKGRECAGEILAMRPGDRPTAMMAANDLMAIGLVQRLSEAGFSLPGDLSVVGFDDIPACGWVYPRLTTIAQPLRHLAREALSLLLRRIGDLDSSRRIDGEPEVIRIEPELIPRSSVTAPATVASQ